uniref:Uncharacterized protein n=1 Tax=Magallana gigas TaxID=29159 RepID=K1QIN1_MAGGI
MTNERFEMVFAANYFGPFLLTRLLLGVVAAYVNAGPTQTELCQDIFWLFLLLQSIYSGQGLSRQPS